MSLCLWKSPDKFEVFIQLKLFVQLFVWVWLPKNGLPLPAHPPFCPSAHSCLNFARMSQKRSSWCEFEMWNERLKPNKNGIGLRLFINRNLERLEKQKRIFISILFSFEKNMLHITVEWMNDFIGDKNKSTIRNCRSREDNNVDKLWGAQTKWVTLTSYPASRTYWVIQDVWVEFCWNVVMLFNWIHHIHFQQSVDIFTESNVLCFHAGVVQLQLNEPCTYSDTETCTFIDASTDSTRWYNSRTSPVKQMVTNTGPLADICQWYPVCIVVAYTILL